MTGVSLNRRQLVTATLAAAGLNATGAGVAARGGSRKPYFRNALSVSPFVEQVLAGHVGFRDGRRTAADTKAVQQLFVAHGSTEVYARIGTLRGFVPGNGDHSLARGLERARLAAALNLDFNPELGLFASYGDVLGQPGPDFTDFPAIRLARPWQELSLDAMCMALHDYTAAVAREIVATGARVTCWNLGNEVEFGTAGVALNSGRSEYRAPDGVDPVLGRTRLFDLLKAPEADTLAWLQKQLWPRVGELLAAAAAGVRSIAPAARFGTHISGVAAVRPNTATGFFAAMRAAGYEPDFPGVSFYPSSTPPTAAIPDRLASFKAMTASLRDTTSRPVFVAELAYPASKTLLYGDGTWLNALPGYPISPDGQARFLADLAAWGVKTGNLAGIRPWAPDLPLPAWNAMALFDLREGAAVARPGLGALAMGQARGKRRAA